VDRVQPLLAITVDATEKRAHDNVRHGTMNLFAACGRRARGGRVHAGPQRREFLGIPEKVAKPHAGKDAHVVLDDLSNHTTPEVRAWLEHNRTRGSAAHRGLLVDQPGRDVIRDHHSSVHPA
jgi:hypothetical protein